MQQTKKKIFLTGATGFLGLHLAKKLHQRYADSYHFTSYARTLNPKLQAMGFEQVEGDLLDKNRMKQAMEGAETVFHLASKVGIWGRKSDFEKTNVEGTQNIIDNCLHHQVSNLIYTSSPSVVFGNSDLCHVDETIDYPQQYFSLYAETKAKAEKLVLSQSQLSTVALRPHLILGPDDKNILPRILEKSKKKRLKIVGNGKNLVDVIHVENAANAHLLALEKISHPQVNGQAFFLGQEKPVNLWKFINQILLLNQHPIVEKKVPEFVAYALGAGLEKLYSTLSLFDREPPMTRFVALQFSKSHYFNHARAIQHLGNYLEWNLEDLLRQLKIN